MKLFKFVILITSFLTGISFAHSEPIKFLFFYPGGEGTQEQAQPILNIFAEELKKASGGKMDFEMTYLSELKAGLDYIQNQKPSAVLLTYDLYDQYKPKWKATAVAKTLQLPSGDGYEQYFILGQKGKSLPNTASWSLLSSSSISNSFLQQRLFPNISPAPAESKLTKNVMGDLRAIGSGQKEGFVLVNAYELANIKKFSSPWAKNLTTIAASEKVPSSVVITFADNIPANLLSDFTAALIKIGGVPSSQPILSELRLKGFQKAQSI